jgi:ADP-heptose:LPS heptosyltransferase
MAAAGVKRTGTPLLLMQPRWLGDVLLCTPAIRAARLAFPDARIDFLTEPAGAAALEGNPDLDGVFVAHGSGRLALLRRIRRGRYGAVIDFRSTGSTALAALASGAPLRVGTRGSGLRNVAYSTLLPRERERVYMARQKLAMLAPLGVSAEGADLALRIRVAGEQRRRAAAICAATGLDPRRPIVALSTVSRVRSKQWGSAQWAAVADRLAAAGAQVLLTSGPGEVEQARATARLMTARAVHDYGDTTVRELAALYQRCTLWVGNDGGAKHIAAAAGTPTLAVIRHGLGAVWTDPDPARGHRFIEAGRPGSCTPPCAECATGDCFGPLPPGDVAAAALSMLAAGRARRPRHRS